METAKTELIDCQFDLGTFEGFSFREQSAIERNLTAEEVINWDHDREGEAEFWPAGDRPEVALLFRSRTAVTGSELEALCELLSGLGGDSSENFLRVHYLMNNLGGDLCSLTVDEVQDACLHIFYGPSFGDVRKEAAFDLFETFHPELYRVWESTPCDGLRFDIDDFLDSPSWSVEEIRLGEQVALIVAAQ